MPEPSASERLLQAIREERERARLAIRAFRAEQGMAPGASIQDAARDAIMAALPSEDAQKFADALDPPARRRARERRALVATLIHQGKLVREIAEQTGYSYGRVVEIRAELGCGRRR